MARPVSTFAVVAALAFSMLGAATMASSDLGSASQISRDAGISSLNHKQKKAKRKALRRCRSKRASKARKRCHRRVVRRFVKLSRHRAKPAPPPVRISVVDDFFVPDQINIRRGQSVLWIWNEMNHDPHNVTMVEGPKGVDRHDFATSISPAVEFRFKRKFKVPGTYRFVCSLHYEMKLTVVAS